MKKAKAHGIGVHSQEEILEFGKNDLRVLSDLLSDRPFFFGDEPTIVSIFGHSTNSFRFCWKHVMKHFQYQISNSGQKTDRISTSETRRVIMHFNAVPSTYLSVFRQVSE